MSAFLFLERGRKAKDMARNYNLYCRCRKVDCGKYRLIYGELSIKVWDD